MQEKLEVGDGLGYVGHTFSTSSKKKLLTEKIVSIFQLRIEHP